MRMERGFTLVEVMIVTVIVGILVGGIYRLLGQQQRSYQIQDQIVDVQQNLRSSIGILRLDVRMAGHGVPGGVPAVVVLDALNNQAALDGSDSLIFNANLSSASVVIPTGDIKQYEVFAGAEIAIPVTTVTGFPSVMPYRVNVIDLGTGTVILTADVNQISVTNKELTIDPDQDGLIPAGRYIGIPSQTIRYELDTAGVIPMLVRDSGSGPEIMAEGVEDFQVAYGFDGINGHPQDGVITENGASPDDDEWIFNVSGELQPTPSELSQLRMVRISMLFRTSQDDPHYKGEISGTIEDHGWSRPENGYRRRLVSVAETIRNISF